MDAARYYLKLLYQTDAERIVSELQIYAQTLTITKSEGWKRNTSLDLYVVYPDGIMYDENVSKLRNITAHMLYIKTLGCNAAHILPFLESPMVDRGFDISDYYAVRSDLGTMENLKELIRESRRANIQLFMDLVFNHVSEKHLWFQKAQNGEKKYRNFFITSKTKPKFLGVKHKGNTVWALYKAHGEITETQIAFPEFTGKIPHYRLGTDGYWYYHTYLAQELDLNWDNPEVFLEMAKVMLYWESLGFHFRLDFGKGNKKTELITEALKKIAASINPTCTILADEAFNFHLCTNIWVSLVTQNARYIWDKLRQKKYLVNHSAWINFLRDHDELNLAFPVENITKRVNSELFQNGEPFREQTGIAGRTFSLIGQQYKRFFMAYFLLASFPGGLAIPYGDEIAYKNTPLYKMREIERIDPRNINRGTITKEEFQKKQSRKVSWKLSAILEQRKRIKKYLHIWPKKIPTPKEVFGALYKLGSSELFVYINLSGSKKFISKKLGDFHEITGVNAHHVNGSGILLGPYGGVWLQK